MAKNDSLLEVRKIIENIRKRDCEPVYLLMGEEPYYIDLIVKNFEKYIIEEEDKDFNFHVFYGNDADIDYIVGVAQQFPVMSDLKLVILKEAQSMSQAKVQLEKFASYVSKPNQNTIFVIAYKGDVLNTSSKLVKAVKESGGVIFNSSAPRDYELNTIIKDYSREHKVRIDDKAAELLAQYIGAPLSKLFGEMDKLFTIVAVNDNYISPQVIEDNIGISKEFNNFELINALSRKNYSKTVRIIKYFQANPKNNPTPFITAVLLKFFSNLIIAHYLPEKTDMAINDALGFKSSYQLKEFKIALNNFSAKQSVNALHHLREFDAKSKGIESLQNEYELLSELIFKIFT